jgi:hypothetical protein
MKTENGKDTHVGPVLPERARWECARWTRAVEDQSAPIPREIARKLGGIIYMEDARPMRVVKGQPWFPLKDRHRGESPWLRNDVKTTMMYIHVLNCGSDGVCSQVDGL